MTLAAAVTLVQEAVVVSHGLHAISKQFSVI